jgi:hypothetical protein
MAGGQFRSAELFLGVGDEWFEPKTLRMVVKGEEVTAVTLKADSFSDRFPAGGLVAGARVGFGVGEGFGQQRCVAAVLPPLVGERRGGGG